MAAAAVLVGAGWGSNQFNQLGATSTVNHDVPVRVSGVSGAIALAAGDTFSAALLTNGTIGTIANSFRETP